MRVAFLSTDPWPQAMPGSVNTTRRMQALADLGVETHLIVHRNPDRVPDGVLDPVRAPLHVHPVNAWPWPFSTRKSRAGLLGRMAGKAEAIHRAAPLDAILTRNLRLLGVLMRRRIGPPLIFESHNLYLPQFDEGRRIKPAERALEARLYPQLDGLIGVTRAITETALRHYGLNCPCAWIASALDGHGRTGPPMAQRPLKAAYVGTLNPHKGLGFLLDVMAQSATPWTLKILGGQAGHPLVDEIFAKARRLGIAGRIEWTGWVPINAIPDQLADCRLGVAPLEDTAYNRHLTSPMKLFDYRAAGLPAVASDLPTVRDCYEDPAAQAQLLPPGDMKAWTASVDALIHDVPRLEAMRAAVQATNAGHTYKARAEAMRQLIEKVVSGL